MSAPPSDRRLEKLLPVPRWPTREEAAGSRWFSPLAHGPLRLLERTWVPAMVPWRASPDGDVTPEVQAWYERFAKGEPGALVVEATGIRDVPSGPLLRIGDDRFLPGLRRLTQAVRRASGGRTKLFIQLIDFLTIRRRPAKEAFFGRYLAVDDALRARLADVTGEPSHREAAEADVRAALQALPEERLGEVLSARELESYRMGYRERVTDLHLPHVRALPQVLPGLFAQAARRAREAGFDGVELHYAHAYTMASFLSARNTRDDGYGGPRAQRVRLPLEVLAEVRAAVGSDYVVGCRYLADEVIDDGSTLEDAAYFGAALAAAGMDYLSLSRGGKFEDAKQPKVGEAAYPYTGVSGHECMPTVRLALREGPGPWGRNVPATAQVRAAVRAAGHATPIVACGGIASYWQAEEILSRGEADVVASARQALADPDWFKKVREGRGHEVRRCYFTNYCEALDQRHEAVTCQRWDRVGKDEPGVMRTPDGRRLTAPADGALDAPGPGGSGRSN